MTKEKGYVSFILHAHLPFIHHPESEDYLEEQWLYEAISETYLPLLTNFGKLEKEKVDFRITMSLTPPLLNIYRCLLHCPVPQNRNVYRQHHAFYFGLS